MKNNSETESKKTNEIITDKMETKVDESEDIIDKIKTDMDSEIIDIDKTDINTTLKKDEKENLKDDEPEKSGECVEEVEKEISEEERAGAGLKTVGIISLILAVAGMVLIGLFVYKLALNPSYIKDNKYEELSFPYVSDNLEATENIVPLSTMTDPELDEYIASDSDANE